MANDINLDISQRVDITCRKGDTFTLDLDITDENGDAKNIEGYAFKMEVRTSEDADGAVSSSDVILSTEDTGDKEITVSTPTTTGDVTFTVSATNMKLVTSGLYVYDIQATASETVTTWLSGLFKINEDVSI